MCDLIRSQIITNFVMENVDFSYHNTLTESVKALSENVERFRKKVVSHPQFVFKYIPDNVLLFSFSNMSSPQSFANIEGTPHGDIEI